MAIPFNLQVTTTIDPHDVLEEIRIEDLIEYVEENSDYVIAEQDSALNQYDLDYLLQTVDDSTIEGANVREKLLKIRYQ